MRRTGGRKKEGGGEGVVDVEVNDDEEKNEEKERIDLLQEIGLYN